MNPQTCDRLELLIIMKELISLAAAIPCRFTRYLSSQNQVLL